MKCPARNKNEPKESSERALSKVFSGMMHQSAALDTCLPETEKDARLSFGEAAVLRKARGLEDEERDNQFLRPKNFE